MVLFKSDFFVVFWVVFYCNKGIFVDEVVFFLVDVEIIVEFEWVQVIVFDVVGNVGFVN